MNQLIGFLTENCCVLADKECPPACSSSLTDGSLNKRKLA